MSEFFDLTGRVALVTGAAGASAGRSSGRNVVRWAVADRRRTSSEPPSGSRAPSRPGSPACSSASMAAPTDK